MTNKQDRREMSLYAQCTVKKPLIIIGKQKQHFFFLVWLRSHLNTDELHLTVIDTCFYLFLLQTDSVIFLTSLTTTARLIIRL